MGQSEQSVPNALNSERPMLGEGKPTEVTATTIIEVTTEPGRVTRVAEPSFASAPTGTLDPSVKVRVHPVIQSSTFGRSYSTIYMSESLSVS